ncbi:MAG TPA: hypothetical protein VFN22_12985 [Gemmatimonadales bacterium]|nr:hypothetical protein [Gemmatimonadales bacterium]
MLEDPFSTAIRELQTLSRMPMPMFESPPWDAIRAALPPGAVLPEGTVHVLVDLDIDATGTVVHATVGHVPPAMKQQRAVAASIGTGGAMTIRPTLDEASVEVALAVAAGHLGARFTPGERDGQVVPVRGLRMGIEVPPAMLRGPATP